MKNLGIFLIIVGILSVIFGFIQNNSLISQVSNLLTTGNGNPGTIWIIMGIISAIVGSYLVYKDTNNSGNM